jgi:hypothetical protein
VSVELDPEWGRFMLRLNASGPVMAQAQRDAMQAALVLIEGDARRRAPQDTRRLSGSITHTINQQISTGRLSRIEGRVGPSVGYGAVMEFGRRRGARMPPVDALMGWVRRHWSPTVGASRRIAAARLPGRQRNVEWRRAGQRELRSRAFALARSIQRKGIRRRPYLRPAFTSNRQRIRVPFGGVGLRFTGFLAGRRI